MVDSTRSSISLGDEDWNRIDGAIRRLEEAWRTHGGVDLSEFLPPEDDPLCERTLVQLIKVDQELRWEAGQHKMLEKYLDEWPKLRDKPEIVAELLEAECMTRAAIDRIPTLDELRARFPDIADRVDLESIAAEVRAEQSRGAAGASGQTLNNLPAPQPTSNAPKNTAGGSPVTQLRDGDIVAGTYEIIRHLGKGSTGDVYLARNRPLDQLRALKTIHPHLYSDPGIRRRFVEEARKLLFLAGSRSVVTIHDLIESGAQQLFLVQEYLAGETVQDLLARMSNRPVSLHGCLEIGIDVAEALVAAHERKLIHRDVKPANVLRDVKAGRYKLADFGLAVLIDRAQDTQVAGTAAYIAPEQIEGKPCFKSDVYSLGAMLYHLFSGSPPFAGSLVEIIAKHQHELPPRLSVPDKSYRAAGEQLTNLIHELLAKSPEERPNSREVLEQLLDHAKAWHREASGFTAVHARRPADLFPEDRIARLEKVEATYWIALAGSSETSLLKYSAVDRGFVAAVAECLGRTLARRGIGMTTEGCSGVEFYASRGAVQFFGHDDREGRCLRQYLPPTWPQELSFGAVHRPVRWADRRVSDSSAMIVIAGHTGTADMCYRALKLERPIVPIGATGGVAEDVWRRIRSDANSYYKMAALRPLFDRLGSKEESPSTLADVAVDIAAKLIA